MKRYESVSWIYASNARRPACTEEKEWMRGEEGSCVWMRGEEPEGVGGRHSLVSVRYNSSTGIDTQLQQLLLLDPSADTARSDPDDRGRRDSMVRTREWNIITNHSPISLSHSSGLFVFQFVRRSLRWSQKQLTLHSYLRASAPIHNGPTHPPPPSENGNSPSNCYSISPIQ